MSFLVAKHCSIANATVTSCHHDQHVNWLKWPKRNLSSVRIMSTCTIKLTHRLLSWQHIFWAFSSRSKFDITSNIPSNNSNIQHQCFQCLFPPNPSSPSPVGTQTGLACGWGVSVASASRKAPIQSWLHTSTFAPTFEKWWKIAALLLFVVPSAVGPECKLLPWLSI